MTIFLQKLVRFSKPFQNVKNVKSSNPWDAMMYMCYTVLLDKYLVRGGLTAGGDLPEWM